MSRKGKHSNLNRKLKTTTKGSYIMIEFFSILSICIVLLVLGVIWRAFVFTKVWAWFIVPQFGVDQISLVPAMGVCLVIGFCTYHYRREPKDDRTQKEIIAQACGLMFLHPALVLLIGWIINLWMP